MLFLLNLEKRMMVFDQSNGLKQVRNKTEDNLKLIETLQAGKKYYINCLLCLDMKFG